MHTQTTMSLPGTSTANVIAEGDNSKANEIQHINSQVKATKSKIIRRQFNTAEKLKIIEAFDACNNSSDRGAFLRKQGLYYSGILKWRRELSGKNSHHVNSNMYKLTLSHNQIMRENVALKKKLAQAEAIIDLQKKVSELLSTHVLDQKMNEEQS